LPQTSLKVLFVASEMFPLIKTGGLADVVGALPRALNAAGAKVTVFLPGFPKVLRGLETSRTLARLTGVGGRKAALIKGRTASGVDVIALDAPHLFNIDGNPYLDESGNDRAGNDIRYAEFSRIAARLASGDIGRVKYDILHAHDWQAGLAPAYLKAAGSPVKSVLTIHNLAFQGLFPKETFNGLGLPDDFYGPDGLEYWNKVSFLKAAIAYCDHITTVSPSYALEIQSDAGGMGFGGMLRAKGRALSGILNGIDLDVWNPETDPDIPANFGTEDLTGKAKCKAALQTSLGLTANPRAPLFCVVSRLTTQKGLDLLADMTDYIALTGGQLALLGSGDSAIEGAFLAAAKKHPTQIAVTIGYNEPLAHRLQAGSDAIFIPSRFEPCGLTQLCAMRYGCVPVVGRTGGLNDTVIDANPMALQDGVATGIQFYPIDGHNLYAAIKRAFDAYAEQETWSRMVDNCLAQDVGWDASAQKYLQLYKGLAD